MSRRSSHGSGEFDGRRAEVDEPRIARRNVVSPEDHRRALAVSDRLEAVVFAGTGLRRETDPVPVQDEVDVNRCPGTWRAEHLLEAECDVERDGAVDVTCEQRDLRRAEEVYPSSLVSPGPRRNEPRGRGGLIGSSSARCSPAEPSRAGLNSQQQDLRDLMTFANRGDVEELRFNV
jgi:hypothetical protein